MPHDAYEGDKYPSVGNSDLGPDSVFDESDFDDLLQEAYFDQLEAEHPDEDWGPSREAAIATMRREPIDGSPRRLPAGITHPSALSALASELLRAALYVPIGALADFDPPKIGDVMFAEVISPGEHTGLENNSGRLGLPLREGTKLLCVYANRYAELAYEGRVPDEYTEQVDLLSRSGVIGTVTRKHSTDIQDPTRLRLIGRVVDEKGKPISTMGNLSESRSTPKLYPRSKMILVLGGSLKVGDGNCAAAICNALTTQRYRVNASRVTGMASARDLWLMQDAGAEKFEDPAKHGVPSTAGIPHDDLLDLFEHLDGICGSNSDEFWLAEFADSILQPETNQLLKEKAVTDRIHRIVLCANDAIAAIGGIGILSEMKLKPDAIAGPIGRAPLAIEQFQTRSDIPVINDQDPGDVAMKNFISNAATCSDWARR